MGQPITALARAFPESSRTCPSDAPYLIKIQLLALGPRVALRAVLLQGQKDSIMPSQCHCQWLHFEVETGSQERTGRGAQAGAAAGRWRGTRRLHSAVQSEHGPCRWLQPDLANQGTKRPPNSPLPRARTGARCWRQLSQVAQRGRYFSPNPAHPVRHANAACAWTRRARRASKSEAISHWRTLVHTGISPSPANEGPNPSNPSHPSSASADPAAHSTQGRARLRRLCVSTAAIYPVGAR